MKRFLLKALFFLGSCILSAFFLQKLIDKKIRDSGLMSFQTWDDIVNSKINTDLIIQGSSRAKVQLSPFMIDSLFHISACNLGMDGTGFDLQYSRFQLYMKYNRPPKYIIQNVDCYSTLQNNIMQFEQYIPYLQYEPIYKAVLENNLFNYKDKYIPLYKYTHSLYTKEIILNSFKGTGNPIYKEGAFKNFATNTAVWDSSFATFKVNNPNGIRMYFDSTSQKKFNDFISYCTSENIKVILVYAPEYIGLQKLILNRDSLVSVYSSYSFKYNIPFLNYSNDSVCYDTTNFYNSMHMNSEGVRKFNSRFAADLKKIIR